MRQPRITPSILSADFASLGEEIRRIEAAGADRVHFDVIDNHCVPNLTIGPGVFVTIRPMTNCLFGSPDAEGGHRGVMTKMRRAILGQELVKQ